MFTVPRAREVSEKENNEEKFVFPRLNNEQSLLLRYMAATRENPFNLLNPGDPEILLNELTNDLRKENRIS
jgi:hypothetical protein